MARQQLGSILSHLRAGFDQYAWGKLNELNGSSLSRSKRRRIIETSSESSKGS